MAFLKETSEFTAGIYQFEITDPVQGGPDGIDNLPLKGLANRTKWLFDQLESLGRTVTGKANSKDAALSGNPTAPTQANGADNNRLANCAYAVAVAHGMYNRDVTADGATIPLTVDQATCGVLQFYGTNAAGKTVTVPRMSIPTVNTASRVWVVENRTNGNISLIQVGGTGVTVSAGRSAVLWYDWTSNQIRRAQTDYTDAYFVRCLGLTPAADAAGEEVVNARWVLQAIQNASGFKTGDMKPSLNGAEAGWVPLKDGTIGNALSGATARASADCEALFKLIWASIDYGAGMISGGRGASANADWLANKTIQLPRFAGRAVGAAGNGAGLTGRPLGGIDGAERHSLVISEMPSHNHGNTSGGGVHGHVAWTSNSGNHTHFTIMGRDYGGNEPGNAVSGDQHPYGEDYWESQPAGDHAHSVGVEVNGYHDHTIPWQGGNGAHNNMQPTVFVNWLIKL